MENNTEVKVTFNQMISGAGVRKGGKPPQYLQSAGGLQGGASGMRSHIISASNPLYSKFLRIDKNLFSKKPLKWVWAEPKVFVSKSF